MSKNISGFPEFLPKEQIAFEEKIEMIKSIFKLHGFVPLDTAAVERVNTLLSKGNDHEIYGLHRLRGEGVASGEIRGIGGTGESSGFGSACTGIGENSLGVAGASGNRQGAHEAGSSYYTSGYSGYVVGSSGVGGIGGVGESSIGVALDANESGGMGSGVSSRNAGTVKDDRNESSGLGLRFDLTVPLARYVSSNYGSLDFPYKRYQIAPVWRGERPQAGRYRQFYQCDVDIIVEGDLPLEYDAEILSIVFQIFNNLGLKFKIKVNNINILNGIVRYFFDGNAPDADVIQIINKKHYGYESLADETLRILPPSSISSIIKIIDKKNKLSHEHIEKELQDFVIEEMKSSLNERLYNLGKRTNKDYSLDENTYSYLRKTTYELCDLLKDSAEFKFGNWKEELEKILSPKLYSDQKELKKNHEKLRVIQRSRKEYEDKYQNEGVALYTKDLNLESGTKSYIQIFENRINILTKVMEKDCTDLGSVLKLAVSLGVDPENIIVDPFLARGLNYYTGTIFEVVFDDYKELGSVCSGGRYENLVSSFIENRKLPGVGMSVGISRIFPKLLEIGAVDVSKKTIADVMITTQNKELMDYYMKIAKILRENDIKTDVYIVDKSLGSQMKYASKLGFDFVIIADKREFEANSVILKNMYSGEQEIVELDALVSSIISKLEKINHSN